MRFLSVFTSLVLAFSVAGSAIAADDPVPPKRLIVERNTDFPGGDLQSMFDTNYVTCANACLARSDCRALTFNERSSACFLKGTPGERKDFDGAKSARVLVTDPALVLNGATRAFELEPLVGAGAIANARSFALTISENWNAGSWSVEQLEDAATEARRVGNTEDALLYTGAALTLSDDSALFAEYARLMLEREGSDADRSSYAYDALNASVAGYLRAATPPARINALLIVAQALEANRRGDDMVPVLRLAQSIQARTDVTAALEAAAAKYGFRITETRVESDLPSPRICATFSQPVLSGGQDYIPYVTLDQGEPVVTSEASDICIEGLEHGRRYTVQFRAGLVSASGEPLIKPSELSFYVRDRSPFVAFPGRGYILPATGEVALPITGVNITEVDLTLHRLSDRNLIRAIQNDYFAQPVNVWSMEYLSDTMAESVWSGKGTLATELNRDVTTRLPLGDVLSGLKPGIYLMQATIPGVDPYDKPPATQWFVVSDLGLASISGSDGLHVFVRSLASADAQAGVTVELVDRANSVLATASTDANGYVRFDAGLARGTGGATPAMLVATAGDDLSFLPLTDPEFDLSDRGVEGNPPAKPIDVFLATDRGVYRAGETVHATALARDARAEALTGLPMTAVLYRPDGVEYSRILAGGEVAGGYVFDLPVAGNAPRGTWRLDLFTDPKGEALASQRVLIEDFLPERIDFDITVPEGILNPDDGVPVGVDARYLFGAPGSDLSIEGEIVLSARDTLDAFPGFRFGRSDQKPDASYQALPYDTRTDEAGHADLAGTIRPLENATGPMSADIVVRVAEGSGRPVERRVTRAVAPSGPVIGIRNLFENDEVGENTDARFQLMALGTDLAPAPMAVKWTVNRVRVNYQWYQMYGSWNWEPVYSRVQVASGTAELGGAPVEIAARVEWGNYEIRVESTEGPPASALQSFYAGWFVAADTSVTPDTLEMSLDAQNYRPGDTARLRVVPRYAGKALVTVLSDRLVQMQTAEVHEGENLIDVPVTDAWGAGAYVTVSVIRPMDVTAGQNPQRALGIGYALVDPGDHALKVAVEAADEADPRGALPVAVKVEGLLPGETGHVTLAAVDVGILNLTRFQSPNPQAFYFGQRRLGVGLRDIYGRLIDGTAGSLGAVRSGGDADAAIALVNPPTEELVAYFSGPLTVEADGYARTSFDLPSFNGSVKLMAVAWSKTGVGQADREVLVRDPVVLTASLPRFAAPGDRSRLLLEIVHATGPAGEMGLGVTATGVKIDAGAVPARIRLAPQGKATLSIPFVAGNAGLASIDVALTTPDGKVLTKTLNLPVEQNDPAVSRVSRFDLAAGKTFTLDADVFAGMVPGTGKATLAVGPIAFLNAPGILEALDRYPYGCTEQITSKALPLLYLDQVAGALGLDAGEPIGKRIDEAIASVLTNQESGGAFGLWYPDSGDFWLDAYVSDFLSRARAQGHAVPDIAFRAAIDNLRNQVNYAADFDGGGEDLAYGLLVLAREGAAAIGDLRYYADQKGDAFATPLAQAQIGAALAYYGDQTRADAMFRRAVTRMAAETGNKEPQTWRADYGTWLRDAAAVLTLAAEAGSSAVDQAALSSRIAAPQGTRALSTQEAAWSLLAANALLGDNRTSGITINGEQISGPLVRVLADDTLGGAALAVANGSGAETVLTLTTFGVPEAAEPAGGNGYTLTREYFTLEGQPVDVGQVRAGDRLATVLTVTPFGDGEARLIVADPLPAGFEIDNPNLLQAGDIGALDWLDISNDTRFSQFRQDRFIAQVDSRNGQSFQLAYIVRAISPGTFHHPAASVEDMYRPQFGAHTDAGTVVIAQ